MSITMSVAPITTLKLWHCSLSRTAIRQLAVAIEVGLFFSIIFCCFWCTSSRVLSCVVFEQGSTLQQLYLDFNPIGADSDAEPSADPVAASVWQLLLGAASPLQYCSLKANHLDNNDAIGVFKALTDNKNLLALNVWGNEISDVSAPAISSALLINTKLVALDLGSNKLSAVGGNHVLTALLPASIFFLPVFVLRFFFCSY